MVSGCSHCSFALLIRFYLETNILENDEVTYRLSELLFLTGRRPGPQRVECS